MDISRLPHRLSGGAWPTSHVQGIAVNLEKGYICYSFTTMLVKTDLAGNLIGTVDGLVGHLGCIAYNAGDGRVWGSLEFKNDVIGKGILKGLGRAADTVAENAFYAVAFDADRIDRVGLDAERDGIMTAVYLPDVAADFAAEGEDGHPHRYGCSGIDGLSFGPAFGAAPDSPAQLMVAYGIYGDTARRDNDHQVLLQYDWRTLRAYERPLSQADPHHSGLAADARYFFYTGNTTFGVQNLCYDPISNNWLLAVYRGKKPQFPNYSLYIIDGSVAPRRACLAGLPEEGLLLQQAALGLLHEESGIRGFQFRWGTTGLEALGNGYFYVSHEGKTAEGLQTSLVQLYRFTGALPEGFEPVEEEKEVPS